MITHATHGHTWSFTYTAHPWPPPPPTRHMPTQWCGAASGRGNTMVWGSIRQGQHNGVGQHQTGAIQWCGAASGRGNTLVWGNIRQRQHGSATRAPYHYARQRPPHLPVCQGPHLMPVCEDQPPHLALVSGPHLMPVCQAHHPNLALACLPLQLQPGSLTPHAAHRRTTHIAGRTIARIANHTSQALIT